MSVLIVLQLVGRVLLVLLAALLVLFLLVLLVPVRYQGEFSIEDPAPHEAAEWDRVLHCAEGRCKASWLGPVLQLTLVWQDALQMDLQILFVHRDPRTWMHKDPTADGAGTEEKSGPEQSPGDRVRRLYRKVDYYKRVLGKEESGYTLAKGRKILLRVLRRILPRTWQLQGDIGLGDPAATAKVLEIQGMLIPFIAGHVRIRPEFMQYRMNIEGSCKGQIRLIHLVIAFLQVITDRKMLRTFRRIRNADRNIERHYTQSAVNGG